MKRPAPPDLGRIPLQHRASAAFRVLTGQTRLVRQDGTVLGSPTRLARAAFRVGTGRSALVPVRRSAFAAARIDRLTSDFEAPMGPIDDLMRGDLDRIRRRARQLARNNSFVRQYQNMMAINVIGPHGMKYQAQIRNAAGELVKATNDILKAGWEDYCTNPVTIDGRLPLVQLEQMLLKQLPRDGEVFTRMWRNFKPNRHRLGLEVVDPSMLDESFNRPPATYGNEVRLGIEVNEHGAPLAYHFWDRPPGSIAQRERLRIAADQVIHVFDIEHANQTRGVPWIQSVMLPLHQLGGYAESELVAARVGASKMAFIQSRDGAITGEGDLNDPESEDEFAMEVSPGGIEKLPDGYELNTWDPNHPNAGYGSFVKSILREVATGLGISYNALANDLENVNYSSMRGGLQIERDFYRMIQQMWVAAFRRRVHEEWVRMALLANTVRVSGTDWRLYTAAKWKPRGWQWVDPEKDVAASVLAIQHGLASRQDVLDEHGMDFEDVLEKLSQENTAAADLNVRIDGPPVPGPTSKPGATSEGRTGNDKNGSAPAA